MTETQILTLLETILKQLPFDPPFRDDWLSGTSKVSGYAPYQALVGLLFELDNDQHTVLPLQAIAEAPTPAHHPSFERVCHVISDTVIFNSEVHPPLIARVDRKAFETHYSQLSGVVDGNYTDRLTREDADEAFIELKGTALQRLSVIYESYPDKKTLKLPKSLDLVTDKTLNKIICDLDKIKKTAELNRGQKKCLDFFKFVYQVRHITPLLIPREEGVIEHYCQVPDHIAGVTEKVALIKRDAVREVLDTLVALMPEESRGSSLQTTLDGTVKDPWYLYVQRRKDLRLKTDAMIKFPKPHPLRVFASKKTEVQREHIALNIARLLFPHVTRSTMLMHDDKPCLFIPFDKMRELREVASGRIHHKYYVGGEYYVESTLNAPGEGMQGVSTTLVEDFGDRFAYFFLTSDPDAMGGYNQNKGLFNEKYLYIFDQVFMQSDYFYLDSGLSLRPRSTTSRHVQGRNRTIIEDCSFDKKFDSVFLILDKAAQIDVMLEALIMSHQAKYDALREAKQRSTLEAKELELLEEELPLLIGDAQDIQKKIQERVEYIRQHISLENASRLILRQVLLLQKLLNQPVLYNQLGRPYRFPFTGEHTTKVMSVRYLDDGMIELNLSSVPPEHIQTLLQRRLSKAGGALSIDATRITISTENLHLLAEGFLYPESEAGLDLDELYLELKDVRCLSKIYAFSLEGSDLLDQIQAYHDKYPILSIKEKIQIMDELIESIDTVLLDKAGVVKHAEPAFLLHLKRKILFDRQQKITKLCEECLLGTACLESQQALKSAFNMAIKLDRMQSFQEVCLMALKQGRINDRCFRQYLDRCVQHGENACNYMSACEESRYFSFLNETVLEVLQSPAPKVALPSAIGALSDDPGEDAVCLGDLGIDADVIASQQKRGDAVVKMMTAERVGSSSQKGDTLKTRVTP